MTFKDLLNIMAKYILNKGTWYPVESDVLPRGTKVRILTSRFHDVLEGSIGEIDSDPTEGGYGVKLWAKWQIAGHDRGGYIEQFQTAWYPESEFEPVEDIKA